MRPVFLLTIFLFAAAWLHAQEYPYPSTPAIQTEEMVSGKTIRDDYRWLEDVHNSKVKQWITEQNEFTGSFFKKYIKQITAYQEISKIANAGFDMAEKQGKYFFRLLYNPGDDRATPSLFFQEDMKAYPTLLVDPKTISTTDRIEIRDFQLSGDDRYVAYQYSRNGSDWMEIRIVDLKTRRHKNEVLQDVRFSEIVWYRDGFYYARYPKSADPYNLTLGQEIYYHQLDTEQDADVLIFSKGSTSTAELEIKVTPGQQYLVIQESNKSSGEYNLWVKDHTKENSSLVKLINGPQARVNILDSHKGKLIALSYYGNNNGKIITIDLNDAQQINTLVEERKDGVIVEAKAFEHTLITIEQSGLSESINVYNKNGQLMKTIPFGEGFKITAPSGAYTSEETYCYYSSFTQPPSLFTLNLRTFTHKKWNNLSEPGYDPLSFEYKKVDYPSADGVMVPMLLIYKKGVKLNGRNPTLLEAYGGFGAISRAQFNPGLVYFLQQGGIYAYAYIRGGGTKGNEWAVAGRGVNKQRSFDDFIYAAQYLVSNQYTAPQHLAATGISNGGLVVGAAITQRPDLFGAAVPIVGVFDMVRFEEATIGHSHIDEYGTRADSASFDRLLSFSPFHNISAQKQYPPMLIITGENDDRVPAYQSLKFAAKMQALQQKTPILLRVLPRAGHFGDHSWTGMINQQVEIFSFLLHFLKPDRR